MSLKRVTDAGRERGILDAILRNANIRSDREMGQREGGQKRYFSSFSLRTLSPCRSAHSLGLPSHLGGPTQTVPAWLTSTESSALRVLHTYTYKISKQLEIATPSCLWKSTVLQEPPSQLPNDGFQDHGDAEEEGISTGPQLRPPSAHFSQEE